MLLTVEHQRDERTPGAHVRGGELDQLRIHRVHVASLGDLQHVLEVQDRDVPSSRTTRGPTNSRERGLDVGDPALEDLGKERSSSVVVGHTRSVAHLRVPRFAPRRRVAPMALQFLTEHEYEVVRRIADRLLPPHGEFPGGGAAGTADYVDRHARCFHVRPAPDLGGRPVLGSLRWRPRVRRIHPALAGRGARVAHADRGLARIPEREWNGPVRGWQEMYREGIAALGDDLDLDAHAGAEATAVRARVRSVLRPARVRRQP